MINFESLSVYPPLAIGNWFFKKFDNHVYLKSVVNLTKNLNPTMDQYSIFLIGFVLGITSTKGDLIRDKR